MVDSYSGFLNTISSNLPRSASMPSAATRLMNCFRFFLEGLNIDLSRSRPPANCIGQVRIQTAFTVSYRRSVAHPARRLTNASPLCPIFIFLLVFLQLQQWCRPYNLSHLFLIRLYDFPFRRTSDINIRRCFATWLLLFKNEGHSICCLGFNEKVQPGPFNTLVSMLQCFRQKQFPEVQSITTVRALSISEKFYVISPHDHKRLQPAVSDNVAFLSRLISCKGSYVEK